MSKYYFIQHEKDFDADRVIIAGKYFKKVSFFSVNLVGNNSLLTLCHKKAFSLLCTLKLSQRLTRAKYRDFHNFKEGGLF